MKIVSCSFLVFSLALSIASPAANIVWVSDNGEEGIAPDGSFHPAVSTGTPYTDQGFVDLLIGAGHTLTRYNPNSNGFRDSQADLPALNSYDLVIVGSAINSGPFNLASRGAYWNTAITKPMIVTKATLIRGNNRMGYIKGDKEIDSAADSSTTSSGKLAILEPNSSIFRGIAQSAGVMTGYCNIRVPQPVNNRGTSTQLLHLLIDDEDQLVDNVIEPGGVVLATIGVNPMDPGSNIEAGVAPTVFPNYRGTGYAIVEWPAGTTVRSLQTTGTFPGPDTLGGYRLFFGCGTRDASGDATGAPNPIVGALDLTTEGQQMFLNAVSRALSQPIALGDSWGQYDKSELVNGGAGVLALSTQTATGFTAAIGENTLMTGGAEPVIDAAGRPRIFQTFAPQFLSGEGYKASLSFKVKFATVPIVGDTQFRFGLTDTAHNQAVLGMIDIGAATGTSVRMRLDDSLTGGDAGFVAGDWSDFGNASGTVGSTAGAPNGIGLQDLTTTHHFQLVLKRVDGGIEWTVNWSNDAGVEVVTSTSTVVDDSALPMDSVDGIGFTIFNHAPFGPATTGSFVISEVMVTGEGSTISVAKPFEIVDIQVDADSGQVTLTWNSRRGKTYVVEYADSLDADGIWLEFDDSVPSTGLTTHRVVDGPAPLPAVRFYRVRESEG